MQIFLMRHAHAADAPPGGADFDRPLTQRGERQARAIAGAMARDDAQPDVILTSPLLRTRQTAAIVGEALALPVREWEALAPGVDPDAVIAALPAMDAARPLLIGHQPDLGQLLGALCRHPRPIPLKKGAAARIDDGVLRWLLTPALAGAGR